MSVEPEHPSDSSYAKLLREALNPVPTWSVDELRDILRHLLDSKLVLLMHVEGPSQQTVCQTLCGENPSIATLSHLKDFAKACSMDPGHLIPERVAGCIYYAAIAAALRQGVSITSLGDAELAEGARWLLTQPWLTEEIRSLIAGFASR